MIHGFARRGGGASGRLLLTTALLSGCVSMPLWAQDATWSGAVDSDFSLDGNWIEGAAPGAGGAAFFDGVAEGANTTVSLGGDSTVGSLVVNDIGQISGGNFVFDNVAGAAQLVYRDVDGNALADTVQLDLNGQDLSIVGETGMTFGGAIFNRGTDDATLNLSTSEGVAMDLTGAITNGLTGGPLSVVVSAGQVNLSGNNSFSGDTVVSGGTLSLLGGNAVSDAGEVIVNGGTLALQDADETIGALGGGAGGTVALNGQSLTVSGGAASQFDGTISGDGALVVENETTLTLGGDNRGFAGDMTVGDNARLIGTATGIGSGVIALESDGAVGAAEDMTLDNSITVAASDGVILAAPGARLTLTGTIQNQGTLAFGDGAEGGVVVLENSAITGIGDAIIAQGSEVLLSSEESVALVENGLEVNGLLHLGTVEADLDGITGTGIIRLAPGEDVTLTLTGEETFGGGYADGIGGQVSVEIDPGEAAQVRLSGTGSTYSGATQVRSGTLQVQGGDAVSDNSTVVVADAATLDLSSSETIGGLSGAGTVDLNTNVLRMIGPGGQYDGRIIGTGDLVFDLSEGAGFVLNGASNPYSGETLINSGTVFVDGGNALGDRSDVTVTTRGALELRRDELIGTLSNAGVVTIGSHVLNVDTGPVTNSGVVRLAQSGQLDAAALVNEGTLDVTGTANVGGDLVNTSTGTIAMAGNGVAGDVLQVAGDATLNGTLELDFALAQGSAVGDTIAVAGRLDGDVRLVFTDLSTDTGTIANGVPVLSYGTLSPDFTFSQDTLPSNGAVIYALGVDDGTNSIEIRSAPNPAVAGISAGLTLTQSLINTVVNRPTSPFVAGLAAEDDKPCGVGAWARGTGGSADATGATETSIGAFESEIEATYAGLQFGFDYSCFDGRYAGFDLSFGAIAGVNQGSLSQPVFRFDTATLSQNRAIQTSSNETDFTQTYAGAYLGASRGRLFADVQLRFDRTKFELVNVALVETALNGLSDDIGVADQDYDSKSTTISGSVGYAFPLSEDGSLNFVPAVGVALSKTSVDDLRFDGGTPDTPEDDGLLQIEDIDSKVAFLSATLSRSQVLPSGTAALNYFGTVTYYQDFGSDTTSRFFEVDATGAASGDPLTTTSSNLGSYTELSVGLNYTKLIDQGRAAGARQFDASVRLDGRFSGGLDGYGLTAQMRYQF